MWRDTWGEGWWCNMGNHGWALGFGKRIRHAEPDAKCVSGHLFPQFYKQSCILSHTGIIHQIPVCQTTEDRL